MSRERMRMAKCLDLMNKLGGSGVAGDDQNGTKLACPEVSHPRRDATR